MSRIRTQAEVFKELGYQVKPEDIRLSRPHEREISENGGVNLFPKEHFAPQPVHGVNFREEAARVQTHPVNCKVIFRIPGGFTFAMTFLAAVLSDCRRYFVLSLPVAAADGFKIEGEDGGIVKTQVDVPSTGVVLLIEHSHRAISYVVDGLKFYVFPILEDRTPVRKVEPAATPESVLTAELQEIDKAAGEGLAYPEIPLDVDPTVDEPSESGNTGAAGVLAIIFDGKPPTGSQRQVV